MVVCIGEDLATDVGGDGGHLGLYPDQDLVANATDEDTGADLDGEDATICPPSLSSVSLARSLLSLLE